MRAQLLQIAAVRYLGDVKVFSGLVVKAEARQESSHGVKTVRGIGTESGCKNIDIVKWQTGFGENNSLLEIH